MRNLKIGQLAQWIDGKVYGNQQRLFSGLARIDSRQVQEGDLFFAFSGKNTDGHKYVPQVLAKAVAAVVVQEFDEQWLDWLQPEQAIIVVHDVQKALQQGARAYRQSRNVPVIAITGSTGKTSTKDLVATALESTLDVMKSPGNFNNEIGLPLTLLSMQDHHQALVLEMGMRGRGQIEELCSIASPDIAVLTNIGPVHLELLGSMEAIAEAKGELLRSLQPEGIAIVNGEDALAVQQAINSSCMCVFYGLDHNQLWKTLRETGWPEDRPVEVIVADHIKALGLEGSEVFYQWLSYPRQENDKVPLQSACFRLSLPGKHQVANALAALAVTKVLHLDTSMVAQAFLTAQLSSLRWETHRFPQKITVINDAYNANPTAMKAALGTLSEIACQQRKVAILGDMYELGEMSSQFHQEVGKEVHRQGYNLLIAIGSLGLHIAEGALQAGMEKNKVYTYETRQEAALSIVPMLQAEDFVLIKASRGMGLEELVNVLVKALR
ncbi:UDP-N-acetylmuramoyl-tripeptide--D-alanyl-D-alanine ligase [Heliorestis convoluta]|uniref:UDP-N-acetylmuramoyl-tripeptide--D-alanyl-D-alanine ligase n=1 Tax=Heliorestis convoluta TaxID=356322 RepID=A0A5Q2N1Y9_9FIRM|nr:UDP-N-acetylmuramoyl-tripeptide--D-alanyl-D-alanine ligase [Heliorestis convoluta]QGG47849.1 UDP-N-acetylmuramoyl-tripeptide--D-alanyl-D-alanine ligase family protein [Heliorestis convoluta]